MYKNSCEPRIRRKAQKYACMDVAFMDSLSGKTQWQAATHCARHGFDFHAPLLAALQ